ncbi:MAG: M23 family metallopeptidase [Rhodospirillaceae bacterium]
MRTAAAVLLILALAAPASAAETDLNLNGAFVQGGLVQGRAEPRSAVTLDGVAVPVTPEGDFIIGFGRGAKGTATLTVTPPGEKAKSRTLKIAKRDFKVQRIDGLPKRKVEPQQQDLTRIRGEQAMINAVRQLKTLTRGFADGFQWPVTGRISGVYGSQRILNGQPRSPHYGVDIAAPEGTAIEAMAAGRVALVHQDMFFTGKTVMIDHGLGLSSIYIHMSKIAVKEGDPVTRGQKIGEVGMTGRATGPHLHWGVAWQKTQLDPALLVGEMPKK